jgi:crossover junction endodeoxyribonuclease RuvC
MATCGIDPGLSGGIAIISEQGGVLLVADVPIHQTRAGKKTRAELDLGGLRALLTAQPIGQVWIEQVHAMPKQGTVSMFRFGFCAGAIIGLVAGLQLPYSLILPQRWQRIAGCGPSPEAARQRAGQLFPAAVQHLSRKRDGGRADALLIAHVGLRLQEPRSIAAEPHE